MSRIKARVQGTLVPGERADQGRSVLDFRVEQDSETKEGESRTCQRKRVSRIKRTVQWTVVPANARARKARAGTQATQGKRSAGAERGKDFFSIFLVAPSPRA